MDKRKGRKEIMVTKRIVGVKKGESNLASNQFHMYFPHLKYQERFTEVTRRRRDQSRQ